MDRDGPVSVTAECPGAEVVSAWSLGKLSGEDFDAVAAHLSACPRCEAFLDRDDSDDSLVADLRRHLAGQQPVEAAGYRAAYRPAPRPQLPARWGQYELLEEVGRGGMGVVYKARQVTLNRPVAVKIAHAAPFTEAAALDRLRTEVEAIARLKHENIVCVHE